MKTYLAFDAGTMGTKTALYDLSGRLLAESYWENPIAFPRPGWAQLDVMTFLENFRHGAAECLAASGVNGQTVAAVTGSGIICGVVGVDGAFNPVTPFIPYLDNRAAPLAAQMRQTCPPYWQEECGCAQLDEFLPSVVARWLLNSPDGDKIHKIVNNGPFVLSRLAGLSARDAFIDWATLSGWMAGYDVRTRDWSARQLEGLNLPRRYLPQIVEPWKVVGGLCEAEANALGLKPGIPVVAGAGDVMQAILGAGAVSPGDGVDIAGTASIFALSVQEPLGPVSARPGFYYAMGTERDSSFYWTMIRAGGLSLRWFRDQICCKSQDRAFYSRMDDAAAQTPEGSDGVLFYPYIQGAGPDLPGASGVFLGLHGSSGRPLLWRSILEGIAFEYRKVVDFYRSCGLPVLRVVGTEGGSRSDLWSQIKSDMLACPYVRLSRPSGGLMANAALAAFGCGDLSSLRGTLSGWNAPRDAVTPREDVSNLYSRRSAERRKILAHLSHIWAL